MFQISRIPRGFHISSFDPETHELEPVEDQQECREIMRRYSEVVLTRLRERQRMQPQELEIYRFEIN